LTEGRRTFLVLPIFVVRDGLAGQIRGCCAPPSMRKRKEEVISGPETRVCQFVYFRSQVTLHVAGLKA